MGKIKVCLLGVGSVASNFIESLAYYRKFKDTKGLIFEKILGYSIDDIIITCGVDIASNKINKPISEVINSPQNIYIRNDNISTKDIKRICKGVVYKGILEDKNHNYVNILNNLGIKVEVEKSYENLKAVLKREDIDVMVNLLPTGMNKTSKIYAKLSLEMGIPFVNSMPATIIRNRKILNAFIAKKIALIGDDLKSQVGTTIIHRALLKALKIRGAFITSTSQINMGGNLDFKNLEKESKTKIKSKKNALSLYVSKENTYVRNIFNPLFGALKKSFIEVEYRVFGNSPSKILVYLESDDKANASGCLADVVRWAHGLSTLGLVSYKTLTYISAFYMKSPPVQIDEEECLKFMRFINNGLR